jgi:hypothetical protein
MGVDSSDTEWNGVTYYLFNITTGGGIYFDSLTFELDPGRATGLPLYFLPPTRASVTISLSTIVLTGNSSVTCPSTYTVAANTDQAFIPCVATSTSGGEQGAVVVGYVSSNDDGYDPSRAFIFGVNRGNSIYYRVLTTARNASDSSSTGGTSDDGFGSTTGPSFIHRYP